jgi:uncharacterized protein (DUF2235 family)
MKKIIICADGTWEFKHGSFIKPVDTNVSKMYLAIKDTPDQVKYYDAGDGTGNVGEIEHLVQGITGDDLQQKMQGCFNAIVKNFTEGDKIYLFGFSRGAYTIRSLGGMICDIGIPTKNLTATTFDECMTAYRELDLDKKNSMLIALNQKYSLFSPGIEMIGVWDTVGALGIPLKLFAGLNEKEYGFLDTTLHKDIKNAVQAIAIDEERVEFEPTLWTNFDGSPKENDNQVTQVWFPGVHNDVGGGEVDNGRLANIPLFWMMTHAMRVGVGIDSNYLNSIISGLSIDRISPIHSSWDVIFGLPKKRVIPDNGYISNTIKYLGESYKGVVFNAYEDKHQVYDVLPDNLPGNHK